MAFFSNFLKVVGKLAPSLLWALLFFFMLFILGIDSQFCVVESLMTALVDNWPRMRPIRAKFTFGMVIFMFILGLPMITQVHYKKYFKSDFPLLHFKILGRSLHLPIDGFLCRFRNVFAMVHLLPNRCHLLDFRSQENVQLY